MNWVSGCASVGYLGVTKENLLEKGTNQEEEAGLAFDGKEQAQCET